MIWRNALFYVSGFLPLRIVMAGPEGGNRNLPQHETPLFERYKLGALGRTTWLLHHYLRSDPDAAPHNHPWRWAIVIPLAGGYWERRPDGFDTSGAVFTDRWRRPFVPYILRDSTFHRVICRPYLTNWSLFIHGPRTAGWGFLRNFDLKFESTSLVYFDPAIDRTSSKALGRDWAKGAARGRDTERAAP